MKGVVKERSSTQKEYVVQFNKPVIVEDISHMIIKNDNRDIQFEVNKDCVLAKKYPDDKVYYIGSIVGKEGTNYTIQFNDGDVLKNASISINDMYKLSKHFCQNIYIFYNNFQNK